MSASSTGKTKEGPAIVTDVNLITGNLTVKPADGDGIPYKVHRDEVIPMCKCKKANKDKQ